MDDMTLQHWGRLQIGAGVMTVGSLWFLFSGFSPDIPKEKPAETITIPAVPLDAKVVLTPSPGNEILVSPNQPISLDQIFPKLLDPPQKLTIRVQREGFKPFEETLNGNDVLLFKTWQTFPKDGSTIALEEGDKSYLALKFAQRWPALPLALLGLVGVVLATQRKTAIQNRLQRLQQLDEKKLKHPYSGTLVGDYRITEFLGAGGMADVYKLVPDKFLGTPFETKELLAIKICKNIEPQWQKRFFQELEVSKKIDHPNALKIFEAGHLQNKDRESETQEVKDFQRPYLIMEYLEGKTVHELTTTETVVKEQGLEAVETQHHIIPAAKIVEYLAPVVEALQYAHDQEIVHRDLTPKNILVTNDGVTKLLDFGLSKILANKNLMMTTEGFGTLAYLSPEQLLENSDVDARTDQFALGALIYQLLAGTPPHGEDHMTLVNKLANQKAVTPLKEAQPDCDPEIAKVVEKMLNANRDERYGSVTEAFQAFIKAAGC